MIIRMMPCEMIILMITASEAGWGVFLALLLTIYRSLLPIHISLFPPSAATERYVKAY